VALRAMVARLLDEAHPPVAGQVPDAGHPPDAGHVALGGPRGALVPHAGYMYSGRVAASAYRHLVGSRNRFQRVVLIGPAHFVPVAGVAISTAAGFATPLGDLPVDETARAAALGVAGVYADDAPHEPEHCLEVQLPFLLQTLGEIPIVPLVVGRADTAEVAALLDALWTPDSLLLVSSDLSHYLDLAAARARDSRTVQAILNRDPAGVADGDACGSYAVRPLLASAAARAMSMTLADMGTSADAGGDPRRVVGYASVLVS
jgi:hypothetical protein